MSFLIWHYTQGTQKLLEIWKNYLGFIWWYFGVSRFAVSLRPAELLAPLADLTGPFPPSQQGLLPPSFRPSRSPSSPSDISTVASGHLHRQDFHLLERKLASLHRHHEGRRILLQVGQFFASPDPPGACEKAIRGSLVQAAPDGNTRSFKS